MDLVHGIVAASSANTTPYSYELDTSNSSDILFIGYSPRLLNFASAMCIIFILIGVPGNLITIIALARCKKVRNATAVFIINLSLSDLLFCCFNLPLAASTFWHRAWNHGELLCQLFPLLRYGLLAVSLFTVLSITINRYVMIGHPRIYPRVYRHKFLGIMVATCWLFAFGALIPTWRGVWGEFGLDRSVGSCTILRDHNNNSPKQFLFVMAFALPCLSIIVCYARIFYIVRKTAMRTHELKPTASVKMTHNPTTLIPKKEHNNQHTSTVVNNATAAAATMHQIEHTHNKSITNVTAGGGGGNQFNTDNNGNGHHKDGGKLKENRLSFFDERMHELMSNDVEEKPFLEDDLEKQKRKRQLFISKSYRYNNDNEGNDLRFIDMSVESDVPPQQPPMDANRNSNNNEQGLRAETVDFYLGKNTHKRAEHDSAVDDSISSSENQQVYQIQGPTEPALNQIPSVQPEPSSSSGIELPYDQDSPIKPTKYEKKTFVSAIRQSTRRIRRNKSNGTGTVRNRSHANTSGASIMYPGRLSTKDRRLLKMILVIFISFLICYLPITLTKIFHDITNVHSVNIAGYLLIYLTTCINPIIYVVMSSEYRQAYKNLLMCRTNPLIEVAHKRQGTVRS